MKGITPRLLVVGAGSIGERHARCFARTKRVDVFLCEVDAVKLAAVTDHYQLAQGFTDWNKALASSPDAVVISTPAPWHIQMAQNALAAGCHVLIEKPLSTTLDGIAELSQQASETDKIVEVAYVTRCHPVLEEMRAEILSGRFGRPLQLVSVSGQNFPFYRPAYRETYYARHETGGGAIQDALTHGINTAEWIVGPIDRLVADADHLVLPGVNVEDTVHVLTRHGRVLGSFSLNQHQAPNESTLTIVCERGTVRYESHRQRWMFQIEPNGEWQVGNTIPLERDELFARQAVRFLDRIAGVEKTPQCTIDDAWQTLRVNLAILRSVKSRAWETV